MKRVACYLRVSTTEQTVENQRNDLRAYCQARGWDDVIEYSDTGISGTRERRPGLDRLMGDVKARRVDVVVVAAFDRFGRSVRHLVETLELFRHLDVEFISLREQIDTGSPLGQAVFTIIAAVAQLERSLIVERVKAGLRRARSEGKTLGRPRLKADERQLRIVVNQKLPVLANRVRTADPSEVARCLWLIESVADALRQTDDGDCVKCAAKLWLFAARIAGEAFPERSHRYLFLAKGLVPLHPVLWSFTDLR